MNKNTTRSVDITSSDLVCYRNGLINLKSLPNQIEIYPDESLEGFLCRLALVNHREVYDLGLKFIGNDRSEEKIEIFLDKISKLSGQNITKDFLYPYYWFLEGLTLPEWKQKLYTRFCSECILERTYHRAYWSLAHHTYCYRHLIFLIENCTHCQKKIRIVDVTKGSCGFCNRPLEESQVVSVGKESHYLRDNGQFNNLESPYLKHSLNLTEQLILTQWLSYFLVEKTNLFKSNLNSTEKIRLAVNGYYHDVAKQTLSVAIKISPIFNRSF